MSNSLTKKLEQVKELIKEPLPDATAGEVKMSEEKKGPKKKSAKKVEKKESKKTESGNLVTLADLAKKADITPQRARQKLREAEVERDGRWSWEKDSKGLAKVKKVLGLE